MLSPQEQGNAGKTGPRISEASEDNVGATGVVHRQSGGYPSCATDQVRSAHCTQDDGSSTERHAPVMQRQVPTIRRVQGGMSSTQVSYVDEDFDVLFAMRVRLTDEESTHEHSGRGRQVEGPLQTRTEWCSRALWRQDVQDSLKSPRRRSRGNHDQRVFFKERSCPYPPTKVQGRYDDGSDHSYSSLSSVRELVLP